MKRTPRPRCTYARRAVTLSVAALVAVGVAAPSASARPAAVERSGVAERRAEHVQRRKERVQQNVERFTVALGELVEVRDAEFHAAMERLEAHRVAEERAAHERAAAERVAAERAAARRTSRSGSSGLAGLRNCESGGDYGAVNSSGTYRGAYQFSRSTWNAVAARSHPHLVGVDPAAASPADQDAMAQALYASSGSSPWPNCGRHL